MNKKIKAGLFIGGGIAALLALVYAWKKSKSTDTPLTDATPGGTNGTSTPPATVPANPVELSSLRTQIVNKLKEIYNTRKDIITYYKAGTYPENVKILDPANGDGGKLITFLGKINDASELKSLNDYVTNFGAAMQYWRTYPDEASNLSAKYPVIISNQDPALKNINVMKKYYASVNTIAMVTGPSQSFFEWLVTGGRG